MEDANRPFIAMWNVRYGHAICEGGGKEGGSAELQFLFVWH